MEFDAAICNVLRWETSGRKTIKSFGCLWCGTFHI